MSSDETGLLNTAFSLFEGRSLDTKANLEKNTFSVDFTTEMIVMLVHK